MVHSISKTLTPTRYAKAQAANTEARKRLQAQKNLIPNTHQASNGVTLAGKSYHAESPRGDREG